MLLNLNRAEAEALASELERVEGLDAVKEKLGAALGPQLPPVIPGQTTIDEALEAAA